MNKFHLGGWSDQAIEDMEWYRKHDRKKAKRVAQLIASILADHPSGLGKPEPLRGNLSGSWSRRVDATNRLVYKVVGDQIFITQARYHYGDR